MLYGYGNIILQGSLITIELALLSVMVSIVLGLIGASAKIFGSNWMSIITDIYTTLIRGIPDLVLMLLIFYGLQMSLNELTEYLGISQINIDPFVAGVLTQGEIVNVL